MWAESVFGAATFPLRQLGCATQLKLPFPVSKVGQMQAPPNPSLRAMLCAVHNAFFFFCQIQLAKATTPAAPAGQLEHCCGRVLLRPQSHLEGNGEEIGREMVFAASPHCLHRPLSAGPATLAPKSLWVAEGVLGLRCMGLWCYAKQCIAAQQGFPPICARIFVNMSEYFRIRGEPVIPNIPNISK